jgi:hypothetical protein
MVFSQTRLRGLDSGLTPFVAPACSKRASERVLALPNKRLRSFAVQNPCRWFKPVLKTKKKESNKSLILFSWLTTIEGVITAIKQDLTGVAVL